MLKLKNPEVAEKKLLLGDYLAIHESGLKTSQANNASPRNMQVNREELFQRIQKQRGEALEQVERPAGDLIDVRLRVAGSDKTGWVNSSEVINKVDKVVA